MRRVARRVLRPGAVVATWRRKRLALKRRFYRRRYTLHDTRELLRSLGVTRGRVVWMQSSWNEFYNLSARPSDLLAQIREMLGPEGTLVMPAFPIDRDPTKLLDIDSAPTSTGLLTEIFRREKGTLRSIHLTSSVCALGPAADFLVRDHHRDPFTWGTKSPYCRLMEADARLICLGLGRFVSNLTPLHAVECLLYDEVPFFRSVFHGMIRYRWRRSTGEEGEHEFFRRVGRISTRGFERYYRPDAYVERRVSNLDAFAIDARVAIAHAVDLGRRGITIYTNPRPRPEMFRPA